jgi:glutamate dehydrogenase
MINHDHRHLDDWHRGFAAATADRADLAAFGSSWPLSYLAAATPERAVADAGSLVGLQAGVPHVTLVATPDGRPRFSLAVVDRAVSLGEVLPILQSLGLVVLTEQPHEVVRPDGETCRLYDFLLSPPAGLDQKLARRLEDAFRAVWSGHAETDAFNQLVTLAGLTWRQAAVLRAYGQYLHQLGTPWGRTFTANTLADHSASTRGLADLFDLRFGPGGGLDTLPSQQELRGTLEVAIDAVENLTADRVLRGYLRLIMATVRTNVFLPDRADGQARPVALKLDPRAVDLVPTPRPRFEVWVSSPRLEGVHLRFGPVARGGLRWSDRQEDLRTEILGLATAQVAKNAVIVPTGAKGGFVLKRSGPRASPADGPTCYREFISALLDVHDNLDSATGQPVQAPGTIAYEGGDAYLVVAADKGTATFSDTANAIADARNFWLGDAFASGGSTGYDHKAMGITAKGAWCSVRRHFAELGLDPDDNAFTAVGIGDMSGDVFGNGMLLSRRLRLVAAFDHRHIFLDPEPDAAVPYAERARLFGLPRSSWADYDLALISAGGGVFARTAKTIPVSAQARASLGLSAEVSRLGPAEVIRAILAAPVDLMWSAGVGTYVKASTELHADAGDKTNDAVRIDADQVRARVVGEGGNLGFTQPARTEYAIAGGKINTDALDNSAGVGCSDREVNIKIALQHLRRQGLPEAQRLALLTSMTDEVADLVLAENRSQNNLLGQARQFAADNVQLHARLITDLERRRGMDRTGLALPDAAEITRRRQAGQGLTSPELALLAAQVKLDLREVLLGSTLPDDPAVQPYLLEYFPSQLRSRHRDAVERHPLRREIIATELVNTVVDHAGIGWVHRMLENTTAGAEDVVRAYLVVTAVFGLPALWQLIRAESVSTQVAGQLIGESTRILDRATRWLLQRRPQPLDISGEIGRLRPTVTELSASVSGWHEGRTHIDYLDRLDPILAAGADPELAKTIHELLESFCLLDIAEIAHTTGQRTRRVAELYYLVKERRDIDLLLTGVSGLPRKDRWSALARLGLRDDLYESLRAIVSTILRTSISEADPAEALQVWEERLGGRLTTIESVVADSRSGHDLANLAVAARQIRTLALLTSS